MEHFWEAESGDLPMTEWKIITHYAFSHCCSSWWLLKINCPLYSVNRFCGFDCIRTVSGGECGLLSGVACPVVGGESVLVCGCLSLTLLTAGGCRKPPGVNKRSTKGLLSFGGSKRIPINWKWDKLCQSSHTAIGLDLMLSNWKILDMYYVALLEAMEAKMKPPADLWSGVGPFRWSCCLMLMWWNRQSGHMCSISSVRALIPPTHNIHTLNMYFIICYV